jgi:uncharacterized protein (TIGR02145 family)
LVFQEGELDDVLFEIIPIAVTDTSCAATMLFKNLDRSRIPQVGDIIASGETQVAEDGFLYKVLGVSTQGNITTVTVRCASLEEAIEDVEFESETELEFDEDGNLVGMLQKINSGGGLSASVRIPIDGFRNASGEISASVSYTMKFNFNIRIKKWRLESAKMSLSQGVDVELSGVIEGAIEGSKYWRIASQKLPRIRFLVGIIPVVITNELDLSLKLGGAAEVGMEVNYRIAGGSEYGVGYTRGVGIRKIDTQDFSRTFYFDQYASGRVRVGLIVGFSAKLYGFTGLIIGAGPAIELSVTGSPFGTYVIEEGFQHDYRGWNSIWGFTDLESSPKSELGQIIGNALVEATEIVEANRVRPIVNEARLDFGLDLSARITLRVLGRALLDHQFAEGFIRIGQPLYRTSFLPYFDDPQVVESGATLEVSSWIERDLLNYPVADFGICVEEVGSNDCRDGNGVRQTFGSVGAGARRSFTASFDDLAQGTYNVRPFFSSGVGGMFYDKATVVTFSGPVIDTSSYTDPRDGQVYRIARIGDRTWFGRNLNYVTSSSRCYNDNSANCAAHGRLYNWDDAMSACPAVDGWRLPSQADWHNLEEAVGSDPGRKLRSRTGWRDNRNGTDAFGFMAFPAGRHYAHAECDAEDCLEYTDDGYGAYWWSSMVDNGWNWGDAAHYWAVATTFWDRDRGVPPRFYESSMWAIARLSVRCVRD